MVQGQPSGAGQRGRARIASPPEQFEALKADKIDVVEQNGVKIIQRSYAIKAGYITDDTV